jgi:hypothetical protein
VENPLDMTSFIEGMNQSMNQNKLNSIREEDPSQEYEYDHMGRDILQKEDSGQKEPRSTEVT